MGFFINGKRVLLDEQISEEFKFRRILTEKDIKSLTERITALENKIGGVFKELYIKLFSYFFDKERVAI